MTKHVCCVVQLVMFELCIFLSTKAEKPSTTPKPEPRGGESTQGEGRFHSNSFSYPFSVIHTSGLKTLHVEICSQFIALTMGNHLGKSFYYEISILHFGYNVLILALTV